jgi:hypothetical protein
MAGKGTTHEWRDHDPAGNHTYYRATQHGNKWEFQSTRKSDEDWTKHEILPREVMMDLVDLLRNKHQRRRVPLAHLEQVEALVAAMPDPKGGESAELQNN